MYDDSEDLLTYGWDSARVIPNPGSSAAAKSGCQCARIDNGHGRGYHWVEGRPRQWVITLGCPVHSRAAAS